MESVFSQTYKPVEIVFVDDGSTDNTRELISKYGNKVCYYYQKNQGVAIARTFGCRMSQGEFIAFQDDDDLMSPYRLELLHGAFRQYPEASFSTGDKSPIDRDHHQNGKKLIYSANTNQNQIKFIKDGYRAILQDEVNGTPLTTLFRKADGDRVGWFDSRFFYGCEDTDFFLRISKLGPIVYVPEIVCYIRRGHVSLTADRIAMQYSRFLLFEKHLKSLTRKKDGLEDLLGKLLRNSMEFITYNKYKDSNTKVSKELQNNYVQRGLKLLSLKHYLLYRWTTLIKHPVRRFIYAFLKEKG
jgi:glycosyltransferase involved in cell wall biosynthesis